MKTVLFIHGGKVADGKPLAHFLLRLEAAVAYARDNTNENIIFLVSGRWPSVTEEFAVSEAEVGKRWLLERLPDAIVIKEDISVELIGNFAFSKPLITALSPDKTVIPTSTFLGPRIRAIASVIFSDDLKYDFDYITDEYLHDELMVGREKSASRLFARLFDGIAPGDDMRIRERLLYGTPYYFKSLMDDRLFFDRYWEGGYAHYLDGRESYKPEWRSKPKG